MDCADKCISWEFEMEAMASGAERVLDGEEEVKKYTGECRFQGFDFIK